MPKNKSGGQSAQAPKQAAGGGASRSSNPQAANRPNTSHPQKTGNTPAKPPPSSGTGAASAPRSPVSLSSVETMSGPRASQGRNEGEAKRNGNGNNHSQKTQAAAAPLRKDRDAADALLRQREPTMIWREGDTPRTVSAYSTLTAAPLPKPPMNELKNKVALRTISQNPDLFKVVTPIKPDVLEKNLKDHPNQPLVKSVILGFEKGFWPWADTSDLPTTYDGSGQRSSTTSKERADFIQQQSNDEMNLERWSKPFDKLLPGMHSSPISAVSKSTPGKYRLVNDQSRGKHSLNSTIEKSQVKVKLDTVHDLGNKLLAVREKYPKRKLTLWKSDVKSAYRQLPVHPLWQIKQAVPVDGQLHIDRCNSLGNRGSGWNWC